MRIFNAQRLRVILAGAVALATPLLSAAPARAAETVTYYHWDNLGSPVAATDEQGQVKWRENYLPYGERVHNQPAAATNGRWFTGQSTDADTGLVCMGARWYDPLVGRFQSVDPVAFTDGNPQTFNRYAYADNNPYRYVDPKGASVASVSDWYDFAKHVGGLLVTEIVYTAAVIAGDEGVQQLAIEDMRNGWVDAAISTAALASPVPGAGRALKAVDRGIGATKGVLNPKIYAQLEKQLEQAGGKSVHKALRSAEKTLAEHEEKLPTLKYKSQVEGTIRNVRNQIETLKRFIADKGL